VVRPSRPAVRPGAGGLPKVELLAPDGARAEVYLHGAHVTSWAPAGGGDERLFLSTASEFRPGAAIRGGVPVIFPQFAGMGPLPKHGFARTTAWELADGGAEPAGVATATFRLTDSAATRGLWPHAFVAELAVSVGGPRLELLLSVANTGTSPFAFTGALHTYLRVADLQQTVVSGLAGTRYRDSAAGGAEGVDAEPELRIRGETDRVYLDAPAELEVREPGRATLVRTAGFPDVVVWNPGADRGAALADLEPGGFARMLCVEAAVVGTPVRLGPGERWTGAQGLTAQ
jgi:glucose-6-phosphate 1-epimerase